MLSNKEKAILEVLKKNKGNIMTSKGIADDLKLSDRTIRNYIKRLQGILLKNGAEIIARPGHGYIFKINQESEFNTFLQEYENNSIKKNKLRISDPKDRKYYILNKLLFENEYVFFDDLCEELFVCRSTLSNDFLQIKKNLDLYNLSIMYKAKKGVYIDGSEREKRHFIMDYLFKNNFSNSINKYVGNTLFSNDISFEEITVIVLDECRGKRLKLSDYIIQNLVLHIALAIKRIKSGFSLSMVEVDKSIEDKKEFIVAENILKRITAVNNIEFPKEETYYIALHLRVKGVFKPINENDFSDKERIYEELLDILDKIEYDTGYSIKNDQQLITGLLAHFYPLRMRLQNSVKLENPLLDEIKEMYGDIFTLTKSYFSNMSILREHNVSDSEWAYICLHFMAAIERYKDNKKLNVLVICATGYGSGQMLSIRLKKEFRQHINIIDVVGYYEITDEKLEGIDLIISSIDLYTVVFNVPVINVSVFLNDFEIKKIKSFIEKKVLNDFKNNKNSNLEILSEKIQLFKRFFSEDCFLVLDEDDSKENIINRLVNLLQKDEDEDYSSIMINQIKQREYMSSVVFSKEIAVPHPAKSVGKRARVAVAIIRSGIRWDDKFTNIKYIFLLSPSKIEDLDLTKITGALVSLVENDNIQKKLSQCNNFSEFKDIFVELI